MSKLQYSLTLIKSLTNDIVLEQDENAKQFYTNLFGLYVSNRYPLSSPIPIRTSQREILKLSLELLFKSAAADNVNGLVNGFMRDARPEHFPAYIFLFDSININLFNDDMLRRVNHQLRHFIAQDKFDKLKVLIRLLIGGGTPMVPGLRDYEMLHTAVRRITSGADRESNQILCRFLANRKRRELRTPVGPREEVTHFYESIRSLISDMIQRFPDLAEEPFTQQLIRPVQ